MTSYNYIEIKNYLLKKSITIESKNKDSEKFESLNSIIDAKKNDIIFFNDSKYLPFLKLTKAKACFIKSENVDLLPNNCLPILVENPYLAFAHLSNLFFDSFESNGKISKNSFIKKNTKIGKNVQINSFATINENVLINENVIVSENAVIGPNVTIDDNTFIGPNCSISNAKIGKNCFIKSNVVIGGGGFGFESRTKVTFQHFGFVEIGNEVHIGSSSTIDRANFGSTTIGDGSRLDNLIQIAHNVKIGKNAIIAAQCGIAGSTVIGDNLLVGGQTAISGHLNIGNNVTIAGKSGVTKNLKDHSIVAGFPAVDIKKWKINTIKFNKL